MFEILQHILLETFLKQQNPNWIFGYNQICKKKKEIQYKAKKPKIFMATLKRNYFKFSENIFTFFWISQTTFNKQINEKKKIKLKQYNSSFTNFYSFLNKKSASLKLLKFIQQHYFEKV